jgi:hypothetical protein
MKMNSAALMAIGKFKPNNKVFSRFDNTNTTENCRIKVYKRRIGLVYCFKTEKPHTTIKIH